MRCTFVGLIVFLGWRLNFAFGNDEQPSDRDGKNLPQLLLPASVGTAEKEATTEDKTQEISNEYDWHLLLAIPESSWLHNWRSGEWCRATENSMVVAELTTNIASLQDVPIVCERDKTSCFKFLTAKKDWEPIADLPETLNSGRFLFVPRKGLVLFVREDGFNETTDPTKTWVLEKPDGEWKKGPVIFGCLLETAACYIQIDETTTAFLGGYGRGQRITTYDWTTNTCTTLDSTLPTSHSEYPPGGCALIKNQEGFNVVVLVTANLNHKTGRGLEIWNPADNTFQSEPIPFEDKNNVRSFFHSLVTVNNGTEILLIGSYRKGFFENNTVDHLASFSKFNLATKTWTDYGEIPDEFRYDIPTMVPVQGMKCNTR